MRIWTADKVYLNVNIVDFLFWPSKPLSVGIFSSLSHENETLHSFE